MWSSNLFLASLQKLNREKRERQPNWTESEKQLLLCLTGMHKSILENKGSDTMSIKRKSEAWDEIARRMKAAGFNRSKERLKQQLGRIRAAEAKKIKDSMEKNVTGEQIKILNNSSSSIEENLTLNTYLNDNQIGYLPNNATSPPTSVNMQESQFIKSEKTPSIDLNDCMEKEKEVNSGTFSQSNIINYSFANAGKENNNFENPKIVLDSMHFKLQNVQSLAKINENVGIDAKTTDSFNEEKGICTDDVTSSSITCSNVTSNMKSATSFESHQNDDSGINENTASSIAAENFRATQQQRKRMIQSRSRFKRSSFNREQSLRQLYTYRISFERERLRNLKLQQKRDRILYLKDVEIQDLKLQILQNLTNQQSDTNRYL